MLTFNETSAFGAVCSDLTTEKLVIEGDSAAQVSLVADPDLPAPTLRLEFDDPVSRWMFGAPAAAQDDFACLDCDRENCDGGTWPAGEVFFGPVTTGDFPKPFELAVTQGD